MTTEAIISALRNIRYHGIGFIGGVMRNNSRFKELTFTLRYHEKANTSEKEGYVAGAAKTLVEIDISFDSKTSHVAWNYINPSMEQVAMETILEQTHRENLHERLVKILGIKNYLDIEPNEVPIVSMADIIALNE